MAAGVLLFDEAGRILLVEPAYKPTWEIPGGVVELNESPREAALREVTEELGLSLEPESLRLCGIEYMAAGEVKTEALMFVFSGGLLPIDRRSEIRLVESELKSFRFVKPERVPELLGDVLGARVLRSIEALATGGAVYSEGSY